MVFGDMEIRRYAKDHGMIFPFCEENIQPASYDCSNGILFEDDRQIVSVMGRKFYAAEPRLEYGIREVV